MSLPQMTQVASTAVREWRLRPMTLSELLEWIPANRYVREFTCDEHVQYRIKPLCEGGLRYVPSERETKRKALTDACFRR